MPTIKTKDKNIDARTQRKGARHYSRSELIQEIQDLEAVLVVIKKAALKQVNKSRYNRLKKAYLSILANVNSIDNELKGLKVKDYSLKRKRVIVEHSKTGEHPPSPY
jgi:hypothetical protein